MIHHITISPSLVQLETAHKPLIVSFPSILLVDRTQKIQGPPPPQSLHFKHVRQEVMLDWVSTLPIGDTHDKQSQYHDLLPSAIASITEISKKIVRICNWAPLTFNLLLYYSRGGYPTIFNCITPLIIDRITTSKSIYPCHLSIAQRKMQSQDYKPLHTHPTKYDTMPLLGNPTLLIFTKTCTLSSPTS